MNIDSLIKNLAMLKTGTSTVFNGDDMIDACIDVIRQYRVEQEDVSRSTRYSDIENSFFCEMLRIGANNLCTEHLWKDLCAEAAVRLSRQAVGSVPLARCSLAVAKFIYAEEGENFDATCDMAAKAVLDEAGVKYVD